MRKFVLTILAASLASSPLNAKCEVGKLLEFNVTMHGTRPIADVGINGHTIPFVLDSGAFFNAISPGTAEELGLRLEATPVRLEGVGGEARTTSVTWVKSLEIAGLALHDVEFVVGGSEFGAGGLIGQNVLGIGDVEYDLGHGAVRLMRSFHCSPNENLAYWSGQEPVSELAIYQRDVRQPWTIATIMVNGVKVTAVFDTGAASSIMSLSAARRAGITTSTPGVVPAGRSGGIGSSMINTWLAPVASVQIGTEQVRNFKMFIGEMNLPEDADMLIGSDFFLSHHIYVANSLRKMYFTYDGGPIFNSQPSKVVDQAGATRTIAADSNPNPTDAEGYGRRGAAETSLGDYRAALADLDHAVSMDPANGQYLVLRARAHFLAKDAPAGFADLDLAVKVAPNDPKIRLARAQSLMGRKRKADALSDLKLVDAGLPQQADERLTLGTTLQILDQFDEAVSNYDRWISAHPDDSRMPVALNDRCWTRALSGKDLALALKDCNAALRRSKSGAFFDSRGLVDLRMGEFDKAIADYDSALQQMPKSAWSLYGRGLARLHKNDPSGQADIKAALAIDPELPTRAKALGIS